MINDDTAPHSMEPQFRKLGMPTSLVKGVPTLQNGDFVVCKKGDKLKVDQAHLLKLFGKPMAVVSSVFHCPASVSICPIMLILPNFPDYRAHL